MTAEKRRGQKGGRELHGPAVLRVLARAGGPVAVPDIAEQARLPRSKVHGLLMNYRRRGVVWCRGDDWSLTEAGRLHARNLLVRAMSEAVSL